MRDKVLHVLSKESELLLIMRTIDGIYLTGIPFDLSDEEQLDLLCAAQEIVQHRLAAKVGTPHEPASTADATTAEPDLH